MQITSICRYFGLSIFFPFILLAEHMQDVVGLLFKYINLLQQSGASKWIFDEV